MMSDDAYSRGDGPRDLFVSVIMPVRNEAPTITGCIESILNQEYPREAMEIIVADGLSDDDTRERILEIAHRDPRIHVISNPGRIASTGLNCAIAVSRGDIIVRMDAHAEYAHDYIRQCVRVLHETGAENVGGPWNARGRTYMQKAIALAFHSPFSSGGASSHAVDYSGKVDSVYLGCWQKSTLTRLGGFDEELVRNQDDELNLRITRSGGTVVQDASIRSWYYPRSSLLGLFRQYLQYGYWKVRVIQKHRIPASYRHLVPSVFLLAVMILGVCAIFFGAGRAGLMEVLALYVLLVLLASLVTCRRPRAMVYLPVLPFVFMTFHVGYGYGFLRGVLDFVVLRKGGSRSFAVLTRR